MFKLNICSNKRFWQGSQRSEVYIRHIDKSDTIKDNNGKDYYITDIKSFYKHLLDFHSVGTSLHEENGHYFTVNDVFRSKIKKLYQESY